jgi:GH25 family lysozyme M1 (1,4-beta-N-acetylmuramidase)
VETLGVSISRVVDHEVIDWQRLRAAGVTFCFVRATFGTKSSEDFAERWWGMKTAGIRRAALHSLRSDQDPIAQAVQFLKVGLDRGDLPPVLEIDETESRPSRRIVDGVREWLVVVEAELEARHGHVIKPMIRTSERVWRMLDNPSGFSAYPLCIVDCSRFSAPRVPPPWTEREWTFHQYTSGTLGAPGVRRGIDLDRFNPMGLGDRGERVDQIKQLLRRTGIDVSEGDEFDEQTRRGVLRFQAARGILADGVVEASTFAELQWP